ncbi:hypothetical protein E4U42_003318 [Claviceps africana]|uniref:Uncharacterized protein n=1 Tax=Claviceps africana TaxID=83212 RepID=A0A8K0JCX2_9HYPO|nr:hypothetical protein E4U42_003318 [Claviceps africana]
MAWFPKIMTLAGLILLAHSGYSAHEYSAITPTLKAATLGTRDEENALPIDIRLQTIFATLLICFGLVTGSGKLHPIRWQVWAGKIERLRCAISVDGPGQLDKDFRGCPFNMLESRPAFLDIRRERHEFAGWVESKM